ncbi:ABC transporter substrate binding protein [Bacterioplanoides sp.]|uniref:ABC transporter substrate binding protein n=1 Tax=Bacterioplanoides sp. TaxID=2066072 RepID=UPI003B003D82
MARFLITILSTLCLFIPALAISAELTNKRILLLYSYHPNFPTTDKILSGLQSAFSEQRPIIDIEFMDSKRLNDTRSQTYYHQLLHYKLSRREPYDLIITADDNALNYASINQQGLFPQTPIVFLGINDIEKAHSLGNNPWITGVVEAPSFEQTFALSRQLLPERDTVYLLFDDRVTAQADIRSAQTALDAFPGLRHQELSLKQLSWQQLGEQLGQLSNRDIVLLISAFEDTEKQNLSFKDSLSFITQHTQVPVFHPWEHGIDNGLLGGVVVSHQEQGRQAGLMARAILTGSAAKDIPVMGNSPNPTMLNFRQLQRFSIARNLAPEHAIWVNLPDSFWEQYKQLIITAAIVFIILLSSSIYLARQNVKVRAISKQLEDRSGLIRLLMDTIPDLIWIKDPSGVFLTCNNSFAQLHGVKPADVIGKTDHDFVDKELADFFQQRDLKAINANQALVNEEWVQLSDRSILLETIKTPIYNHESGALLGVLGVGRDITKRKASEEALRLSASVVDNTAEGVVITNPQTDIIQVNPAFTHITGYTHDEVLGQPTSLLKSGQQNEGFYHELWQKLNEQGSWSGELVNKRKDGSFYPVWQTISAVYNESNQISHYVSVFSDISEIKQSQQEVLHLAYHDTLTNLPNRSLLTERLVQAIRHADRSQHAFALMFLDLDNFKNINDSLGHTAGDDLLKKIAILLKQTVREKDTVARVGGDEFVLLFDDVGNAEKCSSLAKKILETLQQPIEIYTGQIEISASLGICLYPQDGQSADELLKNADTAMYRAKKQGRNTYQFYTEQFTQEVIKRVEMETELRHAIRRNEFSLHYQPQINLKTGQLVGAEALLRWNSQKLGFVPPDQFIPITEETGLIHSIGAWVLQEAARQIQQWNNEGIDIGPIAVNVAGPQITHDNLIDQVEQALQTFNLTSRQLALEVTETFVMQHEASIKQLSALDNMGIELAIDDFGTGYSSLSYLKKLPIRKLKIDKSFVRDIPDDQDDMAIARTIMALADTLNLKVIAEGVETQEQAEYLKSIGCNEAQGYLYSRPLPADDFRQFCQTFKSDIV